MGAAVGSAGAGRAASDICGLGKYNPRLTGPVTHSIGSGAVGAGAEADADVGAVCAAPPSLAFAGIGIYGCPWGSRGTAP